MIRLRRAYEPPVDDDGYRVLVDGIWPRGVSRDELRIERWARDVAPSRDLRTWYGHDPTRWDEFRRRYRDELRSPEREAIVADLATRARDGRVTIVFGARDAEHSQAAVIAEVLRERIGDTAG